MFFAGFVLGAVSGWWITLYLSKNRYTKKDILSSQEEREKEIQKQLESLIFYGTER